MIVAVEGIDEIAAIVFIDIAIIVAVARLAGALFRRLRQPAVVGEILAGIALGPSLLGLLPGNLPELLFPTEVRPFLGVIARLGLIIFMFIVGLELDLALIRGKERIAAVISIVSVAAPFGSGILLAGYLFVRHNVVGGEDIAFLPFALFIGAALSITAFPVLARILTDRGMHRTPIGALALACAAVDDIIAWSLLAVVIAIAQAAGLAALPQTLGLAVAFVVAMFAVVRPLLARLGDRYRAAGRLTPEMLAVVLVGILLSAFATERIGVHAIFGAFVFGAVMPRRDAAAFSSEILGRLENVTVLLLLPVFFIATGLQVDITGLGAAWGEFGWILAVAVAGKFLGASISARAQGIGLRQASALGILLNTRGLTELVILDVGVSIGVLDPQIFTAMVLVAVVTTIMTEPLLRLVYPDRELRRDVEAAERAALGVIDAYRVLVAVESPARARMLTDFALACASHERPGEIVLSHLPQALPAVEASAGLIQQLAVLATATAGVNQEAARVRLAGVGATVLARFSADPIGDLIAQAHSLEADLVLIWAGDVAAALRRAELQRLLRDADCDVVVLAGSPDRSVQPGHGDRVVVATGPLVHDAAAVGLALRLAAGLNVEAVLVDDPRHGRRRARQSATLVQKAAALGVSARFLVADGHVATELTRQSSTAAALILGIDDAGFADGTLGSRAAEVSAMVSAPVAMVGAVAGRPRAELDGFPATVRGTSDPVPENITQRPPEATEVGS